MRLCKTVSSSKTGSYHSPKLLPRIKPWQSGLLEERNSRLRIKATFRLLDLEVTLLGQWGASWPTVNTDNRRTWGLVPTKGRLQPRARHMAEENEACPELRPCHFWLAMGCRSLKTVQAQRGSSAPPPLPAARAHQENKAPGGAYVGRCLCRCVSVCMCPHL